MIVSFIRLNCIAFNVVNFYNVSCHSNIKSNCLDNKLSYSINRI